MSTTEYERLEESPNNRNWKNWGPYVAERQWGTVREDYSPQGDAWNFVTHDLARSNAYRWGEEGIAGFCDYQQLLCLAPAFWNGQDPILKERLFGLTNGQGNHGEDVKELYYHLDSSPTHSYCQYLYKYPQATFPYDDLVEKSKRDRWQPEYEILDTGVFNDGRYFDIYVEYAKADTQNILLQITVHNRAKEAAPIHVLPHLWFRNYWKHNPEYTRPRIVSLAPDCLKSGSSRNGTYYLYHDAAGEQVFCENETNDERIYRVTNPTPFVKDGINDYVVNCKPTVNPEKIGTKAAVWLQAMVPAGSSVTFKLRLARHRMAEPWADFDKIFKKRQADTDKFYQEFIIPGKLDPVHQNLVRKAFGGLLWTKQFYYFDVYKWINGEIKGRTPFRTDQRNHNWQHLTNRNIISMPDKWEYPWYAAWDLAFQATTFAHIDPNFAKHQLLLLLREYYMHPNGQIPSYEWNFSDVNPPVHAWGVWQVYDIDKKKTGVPDWDFLERAFQKLLMNFTWWVNQKDINGNDIFSGGFLGLDNIGVFDRNQLPPGIKSLEQADATSWMAMFSLNMLRISLELAKRNPSYEESAAKFFRHFINIGWAMDNIGERNISLWDDDDNFYYDAVQLDNGKSQRLKIRSLVGIIPLLAVEIINSNLFNQMTEFKRRAVGIIRTRPDLAQLISHIELQNTNGYHLFSIMRGFRLENVLKRLLDEAEFLSDYGIRSLSKYHEQNPYIFNSQGRQHVIQYEAGESTSSMFGGNSNWRGPIWLPMNYLIIQALRKYYKYYGKEYVYEFPTGSGNKLNLKQIARELTNRLLRLFEQNENGKINYQSDHPLFTSDPHFKDHHFFYEFFNGDTGQGLGASHQTGWTALIANLLIEMADEGE